MAATCNESKVPAMECRWKKELRPLSIPLIPCLFWASPAQSRQREMIREDEDGIEDGFYFAVAQQGVARRDDFTAGAADPRGIGRGYFLLCRRLRCHYFQVLI